MAVKCPSVVHACQQVNVPLTLNLLLLHNIICHICNHAENTVLPLKGFQSDIVQIRALQLVNSLFPLHRTASQVIHLLLE